jgi:cardiolipin synthase A/B
MLFLLSITSAQKSILITNSYFIPDDTMIQALLNAAARGVRVTVLVPGKIDHQITYRASRSNYGRMLLGGIQIFEYIAALMHAKTMVIDGVWATVGSTNFDNRSFALKRGVEPYCLRRRIGSPARSSVRARSQLFEKNNLRGMEFARDWRTNLRVVFFSH